MKNVNLGLRSLVEMLTTLAWGPWVLSILITSGMTGVETRKSGASRPDTVVKMISPCFLDRSTSVLLWGWFLNPHLYSGFKEI